MSAETVTLAPQFDRPPTLSLVPDLAPLILPSSRLTEAQVLLASIRFYESLVGIPADFARPMANPGNVAKWIFRYNELARTNTRPSDVA